MIKSIVVHDLHQKEFQVSVDKLVFRVSIYGILKNGNDEILLQKNPRYDKLNLPGGSVELGETFEIALSREFLEETGYAINPTKLIDVQQDFFTYDDKYFQSVTIFYEVDLINNTKVEINKVEGDSEYAIWIKKENLDIETIQPVFKNVLQKYLCL